MIRRVYNWVSLIRAFFMQAIPEEIKHCHTLKTSTRETYNAVGDVICPILKEKVIFNSIGWRHLIYKPDGTARKVRGVIYKLTLFPLAIPTIKNAVGISDERDVTVKYGRGKNAKKKKGKTYALVAKVGRKNPVNVRVVLLKIGSGDYIFYSIMKD